MRINVIDNRTMLELFNYSSPVVPQKGEIVSYNEEAGYDLVVDRVCHNITRLGEPFVNLLCTPQ